MGTTVATNALLERKGDRTLLVTTQGFPRRAAHRLPGAAEDLRQADHQAGACSTTRVVEVDERVRADGTVEQAPDSTAIARSAAAAEYDDGFRAVAIVFMHALSLSGA